MSPDDDRSRLLPGLSAAAWHPMWIGVRIACPVVFFAGIAIAWPTKGSGATGALGITIAIVGVALLVVIRIVLTAGLPHERAEVRAGYTTLGGKYQQLDQLDPHTGIVIRPAHAPFLRGSQDRDEPGSDDPRATKPTGLIRQLFPLLAWIGLGALLLVLSLFVVGDPSGRDGMTLLGAVCGGLGSVMLAVCVGVMAKRRRALLRVREVAPGELVFSFGRAFNYSQFASRLHPEAAATTRARGRTSPFASASATGLTVWLGSPPEVFIRIPWTAVAQVAASSAETRRLRFSTIVVKARRSGGSHYALPLGAPTAREWAYGGTPADAQLIAARLNELRTGSNVTKVL